MVAGPREVAEGLAAFLGTPEAPLAQALSRAHDASVGRFREDLTAEQLAEIEAEAGDLLATLGYGD
jgi:hypothetical protein